jgi:DNA polymerase-1
LLEKRPLLLLVDCLAIVHVAWNAIKQPLTVRATGEEVRAVYGFLNVFLKALSDHSPTHCAVAFDAPGPTFRHKRLEQYKAHRPETPPELHAQIERVRQLISAFNIPIYELEGFEADDILGTLARQAQERDMDVLILTVDTDTLQLVSPHVRVLINNSFVRKLYDEQAVRERYGGLGPAAVPDVKALVGDTSDNIPGVPGVGEKTALKLLSEFGSIEGIYERLAEVKPPKAQRALAENKERAFEGKLLNTIVRDAPVPLDLKQVEFARYDRAKVVDFLRELEFHSMVARIPGAGGAPQNGEDAALRQAQGERIPARGEPVEPRAATDVIVVDTREKLAEMAKQLAKSAIFAFDTETTSEREMTAELVGISASDAEGKAWYVPVGHDQGTQLPRAAVLDALRPVLQDASVPKVAHNANYDVTVLENHGIVVKGLAFDTMLAAHLGGRKAIGLKPLALELLHHEMTPISELIGTGRKQVTMAQVPIEKAAPYAGADADFTLRIYPILKQDVEEKGIAGLLRTVEVPLVAVLVRMQRNGIAIDTGLLRSMAAEMGEQLAGFERGMYELVGHQFNLNSSQQLGDVLFKELRLPPTKRTQSGYSTDAASLEGLKEQMDAGAIEGVDPKAYQVLNGILEYRQVSKIKSTYVDALPDMVNPKTGRIHTSYNQTGSATGRVSSNDPNVQNIPVRTELGRRVRKAFVAEKQGWSLLGADYSQIELRILAHISQDPGLLAAFRAREDIHSATAALVFGVERSGVTPDMRRIAKIMNFGVIYGLSPFGIQQQTGLSPEEGKRFIEAYFGKYPGIRDYIEGTKERAAQNGYVETVLGRRRYIPEVQSTNRHVKAAGERMAINMPVQGTAADIIKLAMLRIHERMEALKLRSMMIIQVHDELIFEVPDAEMERMRGIVLELMPSAMSLAVPLEVEVKTGRTWGDME